MEVLFSSLGGVCSLPLRLHTAPTTSTNKVGRGGIVCSLTGNTKGKITKHLCCFWWPRCTLKELVRMTCRPTTSCVQSCSETATLKAERKAASFLWARDNNWRQFRWAHQQFLSTRLVSHLNYGSWTVRGRCSGKILRGKIKLKLRRLDLS